MIWKETHDQVHDCYFFHGKLQRCQSKRKTQKSLNLPNFHTTVRAVPPYDKPHFPVFKQLRESTEDDLLEKDEDIDNMTLITLIMNTLATAASYKLYLFILD